MRSEKLFFSLRKITSQKSIWCQAKRIWCDIELSLFVWSFSYENKIFSGFCSFCIRCQKQNIWKDVLPWEKMLPSSHRKMHDDVKIFIIGKKDCFCCKWMIFCWNRVKHEEKLMVDSITEMKIFSQAWSIYWVK